MGLEEPPSAMVLGKRFKGSCLRCAYPSVFLTSTLLCAAASFSAFTLIFRIHAHFPFSFLCHLFLSFRIWLSGRSTSALKFDNAAPLELVQVVAESSHPLGVELVHVPRPLFAVGNEPGVGEDPQMLRYRRSSDRQTSSEVGY